jgi:hypothetical protein
MNKQEMRNKLAALSFSGKVDILEKLRDRSLAVNRTERLRRVLTLCCYFMQNLAYYRAGWSPNKVFARHDSQFWVTANGNFLDHCVLEWCKLFGDEKGEHYWGRIVSDPPAFEKGLLSALGITAVEFGAHIDKIRRYRDRFVAHLDSDKVMNIPDLQVAKESVVFYQKYILNEEAQAADLLGPVPSLNPCYDLNSLYERRLAEARREYRD